MPEASTGLGGEGRNTDLDGLEAWEIRFGPKLELRGMLVHPARAANIPGSWGGGRRRGRTPVLGSPWEGIPA